MTQMLTNILFLGDIVGRPGRTVLARLLPGLRKELAIDLVIANGENAAGGYGISRVVLEEILNAGVDVITSGNHIWGCREALTLVKQEERLLRPANFPSRAPGKGFGIYQARNGVKVAVINLMGRVEMPPGDCPFRTAEELVEKLRSTTPLIIIDFHAEATSEKQALTIFLDGKVSAVLGTHTHVPTADGRVSASGTAAITDLGMCGVFEGAVIGNDAQKALDRFLIGVSGRLTPAKGCPEIMGVLIQAEVDTGKALSLSTLRYKLGDVISEE